MNTTFFILISLFALTWSVELIASTKTFDDLEFISSSYEETKTLMVKNFYSRAEAYCRPVGGYKQSETSFKLKREGSGGTETLRLTGTVKCKEQKKSNGNSHLQSKSKIPHSPQIQTIQNCEVVPLVDIGYKSGSRHNYCLTAGWEGGHIETNDSATKGVCWKPKTMGQNTLTACSRLHHFYHRTDGYLCQHLTDKDAKIIRACGK